jgi:hypothetical protein
MGETIRQNIRWTKNPRAFTPESVKQIMRRS